MAEHQPRTCALPGCDKEFTPTRKNQKYCSPAHSSKASNARRSQPGHARDAASTAAERAARSQAGKATVEDRLRDDLDDTKARLRQAEAVVKNYRDQERFEDRLERHIATSLRNNVYAQPLRRPKKASGRKARGHQFLLDVSDAHYGEVVRPDEALGLAYDTDVSRRRIEYVRDSTLRYKELRSSGYPVDKLTVAVLGDMISGVIHEELEVNNEIVMVDQCTEMAHILFNLGLDFAGEFAEVEMVIMPGNHPRLTKKPRHKAKFNNWEFMMGKMVQGMAEASKSGLTVVVPRDLVYIHQIFGHRVAFTHGDGVKSNSFAGIPFYGLRNQREAVQALMSQLGLARVDMINMGHFHQYMDWRGECDIVINPSIKGGDEYGISTRLQAPEAGQLLMEWHPEHGRTATNYITLDQIK